MKIRCRSRCWQRRTSTYSTHFHVTRLTGDLHFFRSFVILLLCFLQFLFELLQRGFNLKISRDTSSGRRRRFVEEQSREEMQVVSSSFYPPFLNLSLDVQPARRKWSSAVSPAQVRRDSMEARWTELNLPCPILSRSSSWSSGFHPFSSISLRFLCISRTAVDDTTWKKKETIN